MAINYIVGNLLDSPDRVIAHGCNCGGGFGSGVALAIRKKWPRVREAYLKKYHQEGWKLGQIQEVPIIEDLKIIVNMATQLNYGNDGRQYVNYEAVAACFEKVLEFCRINSLSLSIPKVGAGLAGGDWNLIEKIVEEISNRKEVQVNIYILTKGGPESNGKTKTASKV